MAGDLRLSLNIASLIESLLCVRAQRACGTHETRSRPLLRLGMQLGAAQLSVVPVAI